MKAQRRQSSLKLTVLLSAVSAIGIILGKLLAFNVTDFMRFSLENVTIIFTGIVLGPAWGAAVGAVQDLVGCLVVGYAINPIITLGCAATGAVSGLVHGLPLKLSRVPRLSLSVFTSHLIGSVLIKSAGLAIFYSLPLGITLAWRSLNYVIVGTAEVIVLHFLLKSKYLLSEISKIHPISVNKGDNKDDL